MELSEGGREMKRKKGLWKGREEVKKTGQEERREDGRGQRKGRIFLLPDVTHNIPGGQLTVNNLHQEPADGAGGVVVVVTLVR